MARSASWPLSGAKTTTLSVCPERRGGNRLPQLLDPEPASTVTCAVGRCAGQLSPLSAIRLSATPTLPRPSMSRPQTILTAGPSSPTKLLDLEIGQRRIGPIRLRIPARDRRIGAAIDRPVIGETLGSRSSISSSVCSTSSLEPSIAATWRDARQ